MTVPARTAGRALKARVQAGDPVLGVFVFLPSPAVVEIVAEAGFDFIVIDQEHSPRNPETVENMVRAAEASGIAALIRVHRNEPIAILHALETGANGVVVPFIRSVDDVRAAASAMHYPPRGTRGLCSQTRAARHGAVRGDFAAHAACTTGDLLLIGLIEDPAGVANIDDIVACDGGLDAVLVGRGDLAATMGKLGQTDDPAVREAVSGVIRSATGSAASRSRAGMTVFDAEECAAWRALGCNVLVAASEASLFLTAARRWVETQARR